MNKTHREGRIEPDCNEADSSSFEVEDSTLGRLGRWLAVPMLCVCLTTLHAQTTIVVPNGSFESPVVGPPLYADPIIESWQKTPEPPGYDTNIFGPWEEKTGVFFNVPSPQPIDNVDGFQAAFLFSFPGAGFFQDYDSVGGTNGVPSHDFDATYEVGKGYRLKVGITTSTTFPVTEGSTLQLRMYHRDAGTNRITVADTTVTYSTNLFTNPFHLLDFEVLVPVVQASDLWAGKHIGIEFVSTVAQELIGGVWDLDHVRLTDFEVLLVDPQTEGGQFQFALLSDAGAAVEVLSATNLAVAVSNWTSLGTITNVSGITNFQDSGATGGQRFYTARELP